MNAYSFVIPARDEAESVARLIGSIHAFAPDDGPHEIIVVDNGSTDATGEEARRAGARVLMSSARTIGAARNAGVENATGEILIFLDADCTLTKEWHERIDAILPRVRGGAFVCAGAQVFPPRSPRHVLWEHWFLPFASQPDASHIGSAHFICRRDDFLTVGGFDESLATGEDYDLCARFKRKGGVLLNDPALRVEHHGFPTTLSAFLRRERWHGRGDAGSLRSVVQSRVAVASLVFVGALVTSVTTLALGRGGIAATAAVGAVTILLASAIRKFRHAGVRTVVVSSLVFVPYYLGRFLSLVDGIRAGLRSQRAPVARR